MSLDDLASVRSATTDARLLQSVLAQLREVTERLDALEAAVDGTPAQASSSTSTRQAHGARRSQRRGAHQSGWQPTRR